MTRPSSWPFRSTDPRFTPEPTPAPAEPQRTCEDGCNGCENCTDYHADDEVAS